MSKIQSFKFNKENFQNIKAYRFGKNWPVVYVAENGKEAYVGETVNAFHRSRQHYENPERQKLNKIHIVTDEEFNKSAALDIESWLIQYMSADQIFTLQNGNSGLQNHNYYDRPKYKAKFELIWEQLREMGIARSTLEELKNTDLFKYSPYKSLTEDQFIVARKIFEDLKNNQAQTYIVNGKPGTGKTILATYLFKYLKEQDETKHLKMALVVPMASLRRTIGKVFSKIKGLSSGMVIGPSDVVRGGYDLVIVDEAHRLQRRRNIMGMGAYDKINRFLDLSVESTNLDWIMKTSKHQVFFYDENQSIKPSDVRKEDFNNLNAKHYKLTTQMRVGAGDEYIHFIEDLFNLKVPDKTSFENYDFKVYETVESMVSDIKQKDKKYGLSRVVAGYAWPWHTKKGAQAYDIEIGAYKGVWNSTATDWVNSPNAINEVGCIHTVQGYDLNYVGVIIGPEFGYDTKNKKFFVDKKKYLDRNGRAGVHDPVELEQYIKNIYKTILTRGIRGTFVYICDDGLRSYLNSILNKHDKLEKSSIIKTSIESIYFNKETVKLPLFESAGCGEFMIANSLPEDFLKVDKKYASTGSKYFVLRVSGDSMNQVGINDGDLVLCRKEYNPPQGKNVVALVGDDATIKEYWKEGKTVILKPKSNNPKHQVIEFTEDEEIFIQGVVLRVLKDGDYE
jgi:DUF2075 family protein